MGGVMMGDSKLLVEMGMRITLHRKLLHLSQEQLAEKADVSPQLLSTAERGVKALRPENLLKISRALDVTADYLLTGTSTEKNMAFTSGKLSQLPPEKVRIIEKILLDCIDLVSE